MTRPKEITRQERDSAMLNLGGACLIALLVLGSVLAAQCAEAWWTEKNAEAVR